LVSKPWNCHFGCRSAASPKTKKADVIEYTTVLAHVGLLVNQPPGTAGLLSV
jgi:hypothetical protein